MFLNIHQMGAHMVLDDFGHKARHGAAGTGDEVHDLFAPRLIGERAFNPLNLTPDAAHAGQ